MQFFEELSATVGRLGPVDAVDLTSELPLWGGQNITELTARGTTEPVAHFVEYRFVTNGFFGPVSVPLLAGRLFGPSDYATDHLVNFRPAENQARESHPQMTFSSQTARSAPDRVPGGGDAPIPTLSRRYIHPLRPRFPHWPSGSPGFIRTRWGSTPWVEEVKGESRLPPELPGRLSSRHFPESGSPPLSKYIRSESPTESV